MMGGTDWQSVVQVGRIGNPSYKRRGRPNWRSGDRGMHEQYDLKPARWRPRARVRYPMCVAFCAAALVPLSEPFGPTERAYCDTTRPSSSAPSATLQELALARSTVRKVVPLVEDDRASLEEIALLQLDLGDLPGALETVSVLHKRHADWRDLDVLPKIAAAQVQAGRQRDAFETAQSLGAKWRHRALIAIADAQAKAGSAKAARETLARALRLALRIEDDFERTQTLPQIAVAQGKAKDPAGARATLGKAERAVETLQGDAFIAAAAWRAVAAAWLRLGDRQTALDRMQRALEQADKVGGRFAKESRAIALQQITLAWAEAGEFDLARQAAERIPPPIGEEMFWTRGEAFYELARVQVRAGDVKGALKSAEQAEPVDDWKDSLFVEIAALQARRGDRQGAESTAAQIDNRTRRVQAMLGIATELAKSGKLAAAQQVVDRLPELTEWKILPVETGRSFDYRKPETWALDYEFDGCFTMCLAYNHANRAGDLAAAAMSYRMAARRDTKVDFAKGLHDLKFQIMGPKKIRKIAAAQAEAGGVREALDWITRLDAPPDLPDYVDGDKKERKFWKGIVGANRVQARLGIADGVLRRVKKGG